jgi:flavin-dependent thymidylate synthase
MKVTLAGATIDRRFWKNENAATPEVIAASYARVSHSPKGLDQLREEAVREVEKARRTNERIVYRMGHSSVAEHAVFNIDIEGASRLLVEFIEGHRLASYTERSQRYVSFSDADPFIPGELSGSRTGDRLAELDRDKFRLYRKLEGDPALQGKYDKALLEQARYVLGLTCPTDIGMTANAREAEYIISRGLAHPLGEVRSFAEKLLDATATLAPSLVKYTSPVEYESDVSREIKEMVKKLVKDRRVEKVPDQPGHFVHKEKRVCGEMPSPCEDPESEIAAAIIFQASDLPFGECRCVARELTDEGLMDLLTPVFSHYPPHAPLPRSFEMMDVTFHFPLSASAFAQLKRHRMATLIPQSYLPDEWETPPIMTEDPDVTRQYWDLMSRSRDLHEEIRGEIGEEQAAYALSNGHRRRVVFKLNLRELYHFVRLRSDIHAQEEIRKISERIVCEMRKHYPVVTALLCGKDRYGETIKRIPGCEEGP